MPDTNPPTATQPAAAQPVSLNVAWLAETLRLRESLWGPLEDAAEVRQVKTERTSFETKILSRARLLGAREQLDTMLMRYARGARFALALLWLSAVLAGVGAALSALGDGSRSVNVLLALTAMLGINILAFFLWLASFALRSPGNGSWLGELWLWLTQKLARGPDAALAPRALVSVLDRNGSLRWVLGGVSHAWWTTALISLLLTLLAVLSARRYQFNWETTLLSPDSFVYITATLGWLPAKLGFPLPSEAIVRASNGLQSLPESAQALWSGWLIGCVVVYGLLPRLAGTLLSLWLSQRKLARLSVDSRLPGYAELRDRLEPPSEKIDIDGPAGPWTPALRHGQHNPAYTSRQALIVGLELPPDTAWPPLALSPDTVDLGLNDTRPQRKQLLDSFQQQPPARLLVVCDAQQTPDRGTLALLAQLSGLSQQMHILLLNSDHAPAERDDTRAAQWRKQLVAAGFASEHVHSDINIALAWLNTPLEPS
ncbi:MAG: DUF2868 domain-containing protein [Burkholderiaceae bacterium]|nr:DUF2868 domain-containing protein [Burkholderiaceae bacterium]